MEWLMRYTARLTQTITRSVSVWQATCGVTTCEIVTLKELAHLVCLRSRIDGLVGPEVPDSKLHPGWALVEAHCVRLSQSQLNHFNLCAPKP